MAKSRKGSVPPQLRQHLFKKGRGKKSSPKPMPAGLARHRAAKRSKKGGR